MKINIYIIVSSVILLLSSCENWLDVAPTDTVVETELFKEATGYRNALNGVYKQISQPDMYGKELTWGFMDVMAGTYKTLSRTGAYYLSSVNYDYNNILVKGYFQRMWEKSYNSIANCNNIITKIRNENPMKFSLGELEIFLIQGEAIALRAFLHFDILRLFAPSTISDDGKAYIPYMDKYPSRGEQLLKSSEIKTKIIEDLKKARDLVAQFDTLDITRRNWLTIHNRFVTTASPSDDLFLNYRGYRMTYPAITAILARVYNHFGMHDEAKIAAEEVINFSCKNSEVYYFTDMDEVMPENGDTKMMNDLILTLSFPKVHAEFLPYIYSSSSGDVFEIKNYKTMFDDPNDYRNVHLLVSYDGYRFYSRKYIASTGSAGTSSTVEDMIPLIRLSEMYYILAEYHASKEEWEDATKALDIVRVARNCKLNMLKITDQKSFKSEILKEVRREYLVEGQVFHYYKKFNELLSTKMKPENFIFPLPDSQNVNF